jgi:protein-S-isoprenylcysteine O-methyltransferase Ste14
MAETQPQPVNQKIRFWIARLAMLACLPLILFAQPAWLGHPVLEPLLRVLGTLLIIFAVLYRFWAILYIGGRKNQRVVQDGPYAMSRHPLYFGTTMGAFGFGLLLGSVILSLVLGALALIILTGTARREERFLRSEFGSDYDNFAQQVRNRILPRIGQFHTDPEVTFKPRILRTNFGDALAFLLCLPLAEALMALKSAGYLGRFVLY